MKQFLRRGSSFSFLDSIHILAFMQRTSVLISPFKMERCFMFYVYGLMRLVKVIFKEEIFETSDLNGNMFLESSFTRFGRIFYSGIMILL